MKLFKDVNKSCSFKNKKKCILRSKSVFKGYLRCVRKLIVSESCLNRVLGVSCRVGHGYGVRHRHGACLGVSVLHNLYPTGDDSNTEASQTPYCIFRTPYEKLERGRPQNLLSILRKCRHRRVLRQIHAHLITSSRASLLYRLLSSFLAAGDTFYAASIFRHLPTTPKLFSINSILQQNSAFPLFKCLISRPRPRPNTYTFAFVLKACSEDSALVEGEQVHAQSVRSGLAFNPFVETSLVNLYAKCGEIGCAHKVFDEMPERNVVAWSALISGYVRLGRVGEALELFREMQLLGVLPDEVTMVSVISACAASGALDTGVWVHAFVDKFGNGGDIELRTALVNMYAKCGSIERAKQVFDAMLVKDTKAWSSMIIGLAIHGLAKEALELFSEMEAAKVRPNHVTFIGVLSACAHAGLVEAGRKHWLRILESGIEPSMELFGCMVDVLCRGSHVEEAFAFVEAMPVSPNPVILRTLLMGCKESKDMQKGEIFAERLLDMEPMNAGNYVLLCNLYASGMQWEKLRSVRRKMKEMKIDVEVPGCSSIEVDGFVHEFVMGDWSHSESGEIREILLVINDSLDLDVDFFCEQEL